MPASSLHGRHLRREIVDRPGFDPRDHDRVLAAAPG